MLWDLTGDEVILQEVKSRSPQRAQLSVSDGTRLKRENDGERERDDIC